MAEPPITPPAGPSSGEDWPSQAADAIVRAVGSVRDRTTGTAITAARAVVYGLLAAILGLAALVLLCILLVRGVVVGADALLSLGDYDRPGRAVWIAHLVVGLTFAFLGMVLWKRAVAVSD